MKIAICVPHTGIVKARFAQSLADLVAQTLLSDIRVDGEPTRPDIITIFGDEGSIDLKRTQIALAVRQERADYALWLDADHTFPPYTLLALMKHDRPIIGCNYPARISDVLTPTAKTPLGTVHTTAQKAKAGVVEEVGGIGFGVCLMKGAILGTVPQPWFQTTIRPDGTVECGEDVHFCNQARSVGIPTFVDHALSWEVGHIAETVLSFREFASVNIDQPKP